MQNDERRPITAFELFVIVWFFVEYVLRWIDIHWVD